MIERVLEADWEAWRDARLEAARLHPEAFGASFEEEKERSEEDWRRALRLYVTKPTKQRSTRCVTRSKFGQK